MTAGENAELAADRWGDVEYVMGRAELPGRASDAEITVTAIGGYGDIWPIVTWTWHAGTAAARSVASITPGLVLETHAAGAGGLDAKAWGRDATGARILVAAASARRAGPGWTQVFSETGAMQLPAGARARIERYLFA